MQNYLICFQTPYDSVKYITKDISYPTSLPYSKFLDFIANIFVINFEQFKDHIDKFHTILIDLDTHEWEVLEQEKGSATFKQLFDLKEQRDKEKEESKNKYDNISSKKKFIDKINRRGDLHKGNPMNYNKDFYKVRG